MADESFSTAVTRSDDRHRYEVTVDDEPAGFTDFVDHEGQRIFHHTEIGAEFGGRGLGSTLIGRALADTRSAGLRVVPVCSFVANYLDKHPELADIVDPVTEEAQETVRERVG